MNWQSLMPMVAQWAPTLGKMLGGLLPIPFGGAIGEEAGQILAHALGVAPTPDAINTALTTLPADQVQAKLEAAEAEAVAKWPALAQIAGFDAANYQAALKDNEAARQQTLSLAASGSGIAWGAPVVSVLVVMGFLAILTLWTFHPQGDSPVLTLLVGTLAAAFGQVVSYWLGSSAGSKDKDTALRNVVTANVASTATVAAKTAETAATVAKVAAAKR